MPYQVLILPAARKGLKQLPRIIQERIDAHILTLSDNPRPIGAAKVQGFQNVWRIRIGDYRVVYQIEDDRLVVLVIRVGHRKDVYRNFKL